MRTLLGQLGAAVAQLLYPALCCACDTACDEDSAFCAACAITLVENLVACPRCGLPLTQGPEPAAPAVDLEELGAAAGVRAGSVRCLACIFHPPPYAAASSPYLFGGALARGVRRLKWGRRPELARPLGRLLGRQATAQADLAVPVPLHPRRLRARQFNQAAALLLAARRAGVRLPQVELGALRRVRDTPPQSALGPRERRDNVRGAFVAHHRSLAGARVLLVDDVLTTGATAAACTQALIEAGAREVRVLTVARAVP